MEKYKALKCDTKHLYAIQTRDDNNFIYYQIWDKSNNLNPIILYIDNDNMKVHDSMPNNLFEYEFIDELQYILQFLFDLYENGGFDNGTI